MKTLRNSISYAALAMALLAPAGLARSDVPEFSIGGHVSPESYPGMRLAWRDEFSGTRLDAANWLHETGTGSNGWGNNELQFYRPENTRVEGGFLVITAQAGEHKGRGWFSGPPWAPSP